MMTRKTLSRIALVLLGALALAALPLLATQPWVMPVTSLPPAVDAAALQAHVKKLSVDLHPRDVAHPGRLRRTADYIEAQLRSTGAAVAVQEYSADGARFRNIVARFGPQAGPLLVIGAHYDAHDDTPGADDNASGVAGLLELARLLARAPQPRAIELVAYTLEEPPYFRTQDMGSAHHAAGLRAQGGEVALMLSLEMIGYFSDAPGSQDYPWSALAALYPDRGNYIALVGHFGDFGKMRQVKALMLGASPLPVYSVNAPPLVPGIDFSDHLNYWAAGYPAIMVTDTAFNRNREYHRAGDSWERLDYARMAQVVQGIYAVTQSMH